MSEMVPEGWEAKNLGEIGRFSKGKGISKKDVVSRGVPCIRYAEIYTEYDFVIKKFKSFIHRDERSNSKKIQKNDIIFAGSGETVEDIGKSVAFISDLEAFVGGDAILLSPSNEIDSVFLSYQLNDDIRRKQLRKLGQGSSVIHIYSSGLEKMRVKLPPLPEQKKIASILTSVDEVIEKTQSQIDKLQDLKKGTINELLTKGIGHTEFKDSELGRIPNSWEVASIAEISDFVTSGSRGWSQYYSERGAIFIRIGNLTRDNINLDFEDTVRVTPPVNGEGVRTKVSLGDILISITADLGVIGVVHEGVGEAYVNQHVSLVRLKENSSVIARWAGHYLSGEVCQYQFRIKNDGGAKAGLNLPTIRSIRLAQPSIIEQERICGILDGFDTQIHRNRIKLHQTKSLKKSLMQDLLTGKVRVSVN